ncbi:29063_t:CDS:2 [Racocetra persica]|uniref:29063_t:CDS:1 n=1 Tax=Racocetra persica TaxID=160502 RepID=A0ACA9R3M5_9GLOM|nr:29063_t:CDS:2 [Racocetra persica]
MHIGFGSLTVVETGQRNFSRVRLSNHRIFNKNNWITFLNMTNHSLGQFRALRIESIIWAITDISEICMLVETSIARISDSDYAKYLGFSLFNESTDLRTVQFGYLRILELQTNNTA